MTHIGTLIPAYGKDYKSVKEVKQALLADGADFMLQTYNDSGYTNKTDLDRLHSGGWSVTVRFSRLTKVTVVKSTDKVTKSPTKTPGETKSPSLSTMERWMSDSVAKATDGCQVEPDGHCSHGKPSWLIKLGMI